MNKMTNSELASRLRENAEWCDANEWEIPLCMGDDQREAANRLEAMGNNRTEPDKASSKQNGLKLIDSVFSSQHLHRGD